MAGQATNLWVGSNLFSFSLNRNCLLMLRGLDGAGEAELGDLADEAIGLVLGCGAVIVVGTEILVEGAVAKHVIDGGQDRGSDGTDGFLGAATVTQALELSLQVTSLLAGG